VKRLFDLIASGIGLFVLSPLLAILSFLIWLQDFHSPFYIAPRTGKDDRPYRMVKFRSMVIRADKSGVDSTAGNDPRITRLGHFIRRFKFDELPQLWNVFKGEMSLVGPRPNVKRETDIYTAVEKGLLSVRPGITDIASVVFADEGDILAGSADPDLRYNQVIRPWKSRLGLLYVKNAGLALDIRLILLTAKNSADRRAALDQAAQIVQSLGGEPDLVKVATRIEPLVAAPPPGAKQIVQSRDAVPV
jgi:lipopolysaccharide/colanic/teichoic acid biosynthesis glycosyltransferase